MQIDDDLIRSCIANNRVAQKQLYGLLLPYLRAVANRYLRDNSYIKDALQESFVKIFKNVGKYDSQRASFPSWAAKITINSCLNYNLRVIGAPKDEFVVETHQPIVRSFDEKWSTEELLLILKRMPEVYFQVYNLFVIDGYAHEEIATMLGISEALSRKRLSRGRAWINQIQVENPDWMAQFNLSPFSKN